MGERGQIYIKDTGVYLYTHWGGEELRATLRAALSKRWRWDDAEYLARIIFCEMVEGAIDKETGYGIGTAEHGDLNYPLLTVDCDRQTVAVEATEEYSFEEFLSA